MDDLGNRMKAYESVSEWILPRRIPVVIRVDGRAFHTLARQSFGKGWSQKFVDRMVEVATEVSAEMQGCDFVYCQSDEVSFLLTDYKTVNTQPWFGYDARKMISISASIASGTFSRICDQNVSFDSRAFSIPQDDVCNYFLWRQQDATRNAIQMAARERYSHADLLGKSCDEMQEMLWRKGINFNDLPVHRKRGFCIVDGILDLEIPIFSQDRNYVEKSVYVRED